MRFSFFNVARQALSGNEGWPEQWRSPEPKAAYDVVIVGAAAMGSRPPITSPRSTG